MKILYCLLFIFLIPLQSNNIIEKPYLIFKEVSKQKNYIEATDFLPVYSNITTISKLIFISYNKKDNKSILVIKSINDGTEKSFLFNGFLWRPQIIQFKNLLYVFKEKLYIIDINSYTLKEIDLTQNDYKYISIHKINNNYFLIASRDEGIDIYSLENFKPTLNLKREQKKKLGFDFIVLKDGVLYYRTRRNVMVAYNILHKNIKWIYDAGKIDVYLAGIKVASNVDLITEYKIENDYLYINTIGGTIAKINLNNGKEIIKKYRFKGTGPFAGYMPHIQMYDMNGDEIKDIIGPSMDLNVYCINGKNLELLWESNTGDESNMLPSLYDITGDNIPEVFTVSKKIKLSIINGKDGSLIKEILLNDNNEIMEANVLIADIDNNGKADIVTKGGRDRLKIFEIKNSKVNKSEILYDPFERIVE